MEIKKKSVEELKKIVAKDYGIFLSNEELNDFGRSLLRLTRIANAALARAEEKT